MSSMPSASLPRTVPRTGIRAQSDLDPDRVREGDIDRRAFRRRRGIGGQRAGQVELAMDAVVGHAGGGPRGGLSTWPLGRTMEGAGSAASSRDRGLLVAGVLSPQRRRFIRVGALVGSVASIGILVLVFVALPLLFPTPRTPGCECPLNVTPLAFGPPSEGSAGPNHWYNFTVQSAGGGIVLENIGLAIETATGTDVVPGASWTALLLGLGGELVGTVLLRDGQLDGRSNGGHFEWSGARGGHRGHESSWGRRRAERIRYGRVPRLDQHRHSLIHGRDLGERRGCDSPAGAPSSAEVGMLIVSSRLIPGRDASA